MCLEWEFSKRIIKKSIRYNRKITKRLWKIGRNFRILKWLELFYQFKKDSIIDKIRKRIVKKNYSLYRTWRWEFWFNRK